MLNLDRFLPQDRRRSLATGRPLPERAWGGAAFVDVSGFTTLSDVLLAALGPRRGAEELTRHIDRVYDALVGAAEQYGGSVIDFAGDSMLCWFDAGADDAGADGSRDHDLEDPPEGARGAVMRALAAAFAMQRRAADFAKLSIGGVVEATVAIKVSVAAGPARRIVAGDPEVALLDILAGATLDRLGEMERQARSGEVLVDAAGAQLVADAITPGELRADGARVVERLLAEARPEVAPDDISLPDDAAAPWVLADVRERLAITQGDFLGEIRPAVALLAKFGGFDYQRDPDAGAKLDALIRWVQQRASTYEGHLLQVVMGDKGSYLNLVFGALTAHEDNAIRAVRAALDLRDGGAGLPGLGDLQIGISRGHVHVGTYGGPTRRTYGVMGRAVNVAARMMMQAGRGEILASREIVDALRGAVEYREYAPLVLKGLAQPQQVFALQRRLSSAERATAEAVPLVGRDAERARLREQLEEAARGGASAVLIEGEPGIGKSELLRHALEEARELGIVVLTGAGSSLERATLYHAWRPVFTRLLGLGTMPADAAEAAARVLDRLRDFPDGERLAPLMGTVLQLPIADTPATAALTGQVRAETARSWLADLLASAATHTPLLVAIEDAHWLDSASWALLLRVATRRSGVLLVSARAGTADGGPELEMLRTSPEIDRITLGPLEADDVAAMVARRLGVRELPPRVATLIREKAEGNPFFSEELAFALRDTGVIAVAEGACRIVGDLSLDDAIPDSVEGVVTSRIDRLAASQQLALKVASVIGRLFAYRLVHDVHPVPAELAHLPEDLSVLVHRDLTALHAEQPDLVYRFRHAITQSVAYNLMLYDQRRRLHRAVAEWYERWDPQQIERVLPIVAQHWSEVASDPEADVETLGTAVRRLRQASEQAAQAYANGEAVAHGTRAIELLERLPASAERNQQELALQATLGFGLTMMRGYGDPAVARAYSRAFALSEEATPSLQLGFVLYGLFSFYASRGEYEPAVRLAERLMSLGTTLDDAPIRAVAHQCAGIVAFLRGEIEAGLGELLESRRIASQLDDSALFQYGGDFQSYTGAWIALAHGFVASRDAASRDAAWQAYHEALDRSRDQPFARGFVLSFAGIPALSGDVEQTIVRADELSALAERYGFVLFGAVAGVYRGWALARRDRAAEGVAMISQQLSLLRAIHLNSFLPWFLALLADAQAATGQLEDARASLAEADELASAAGGSFCRERIEQLRATLS